MARVYLLLLYINFLATHQLLHVPSEVEAGQSFLLLGIVVCSPLGLLLLFTSSFVLDKH